MPGALPRAVEPGDDRRVAAVEFEVGTEALGGLEGAVGLEAGHGFRRIGSLRPPSAAEGRSGGLGRRHPPAASGGAVAGDQNLPWDTTPRMSAAPYEDPPSDIPITTEGEENGRTTHVERGERKGERARVRLTSESVTAVHVIF